MQVGKLAQNSVYAWDDKARVRTAVCLTGGHVYDPLSEVSVSRSIPRNLSGLPDQCKNPWESL